MNELAVHRVGEGNKGLLAPVSEPIAVDTFGGRIHVEWDPQAAVTPLGQLPFFIEFLQASGLYEPWVAHCPLAWVSPNAPRKGDVLGTVLLSVLSGHHQTASGNCGAVNGTVGAGS